MAGRGIVFNIEVLMVIPRAFLPARYRSGRMRERLTAVGFSQYGSNGGGQRLFYHGLTWPIIYRR